MSNTIFVARVVIEATTPLHTGSGKSDLFTDKPVRKDWNGLPMILGTSIAGVLRHFYTKDEAKELFGFQEKNEDEGAGSRVIVSNALLCDSEMKVHESLEVGLESNDFLSNYFDLPIREHVAIDHTGAAKKHHKFDEEVVYKGSRFKFDIELHKGDEEEWKVLIGKLYSNTFRLGSGSTKGFGAFKVISLDSRKYTVKEYAQKPSSLDGELIGGETVKVEKKSRNDKGVYRIALTPEDFFIFGAGFGDDEVDDVAVKERVVVWKDNEGEFANERILMPASSIKGALSHRLAYHYNRLANRFADEVDNIDAHIGTNNEAVKAIFGAPKGEEDAGKGALLMSDMFQEDKKETKIFDHVKIDRFTGGVMDSALFNEKTIAQKDMWKIEMVLTRELKDEKIKEAFEATLNDLVSGMLPLGGMVNRGHGIFLGVSEQNGGYGDKGWDLVEAQGEGDE